MHYRLLDILACPLDGRFPLKLLEPMTAAAKFEKVLCCRDYCSFNGSYISKLHKVNCSNCNRTEILSATLVCSECGSRFPISDGIPRLISLREDAEVGHDDADKKREMAARDRDAHHYDRLRSLALLTRVEKPVTLNFADLKKDEMIVELGSGTGRFTIDLARAAAEVVALDFSIESLKLCREKSSGDNIHLIQADITRLPLRSAVFDKAISCQVFEHLSSKEARLLGLSEASRVLKDNGELTISVYRRFWFSNIFGRKEGYHAGGIYYYRFASSEFKSFLNGHFEILDYQPNIGYYIQLARCRKRVT